MNDWGALAGTAVAAPVVPRQAPFFRDERAALGAVRFFERLLHHPKGPLAGRGAGGAPHHVCQGWA